jgi:glycerophosphoryl diester phosphodiesterase
LTGFLFSCNKKKDNNTSDNQNPFLIAPGSRALIVAHRGKKGLKPENTIVAFDNAVAMNVVP